MRKAIVSFANNEERYIKGQQRQQSSLKAVGWDGDYFAFRDYDTIHSPAHDVVPYAFKAYAIEHVRRQGYDTVLWMDSPVYATKPIDKVIEAISGKGMLLFDNIGFTIGDYTSDKCLELMGMTREESFTKPMVMACVMGFDFTNPHIYNNIFKPYYELAKKKGHYEGDWNNANGQVSADTRVRGHRHDQSVISILAAQQSYKLVHPHSTYFAYFNHPGHMPHAETVCLLSGGL